MAAFRERLMYYMEDGLKHKLGKGARLGTGVCFCYHLMFAGNRKYGAVQLHVGRFAYNVSCAGLDYRLDYHWLNFNDYHRRC